MRQHETNKPFSLRDYLIWCLSQNGSVADAKLIEKALKRVVSILKARRKREQHEPICDAVRALRRQRIDSPLLLFTLAADIVRKNGSVLDLEKRDALDLEVKSALPEYDLLSRLAACQKLTAADVEKRVVTYQHLRSLADEFIAAAKPRELANLADADDFDDRVINWFTRRAWLPKDRLVRVTETFVNVLGCRDSAHELIVSIGEARLMTLLDRELIDTALRQTMWGDFVADIRRHNAGERDPSFEARLQMHVLDMAHDLIESNPAKHYSLPQVVEAFYTALGQIDHPGRGHHHTEDFFVWLAACASIELAQRHYRSLSRWKKLPPRNHQNKPFGQTEALNEELTARSCWLHFLMMQTAKPERGWAQFLLRAEEGDALSYEKMSKLLALMDVRISPEALRTNRCRMLRSIDAIKLVFELDEWGDRDANNLDAILRKLVRKLKRPISPEDQQRLRGTIVSAILAAADSDALLVWPSAATALVETVDQDRVLAAARTIEDLTGLWASGGGDATGVLSRQVVGERLARIRHELCQDPGKLERSVKISRQLKMKDLQPCGVLATIVLGYTPEKTMKLVKFEAPADSRAFQSLLEAIAQVGDDPVDPPAAQEARDRQR